MFTTLGLCVAVLWRVALAGMPPGRPEAQPESSRVVIRGLMLDDETGDAIESFTVESGRIKDEDPAATVWGSQSWSMPNLFRIEGGKSVPIASNRPGEFVQSLEVGKAGGREREWLRVVADGYEPRPVPDRPPEVFEAGKTFALMVRLKRGRPLIGRVVYHDGRPAAGAKLFLIRPSGSSIRVVDGVIGEGHDSGLLDPGVTRAVADAQGRFRLTGVGDAKAIGVSAASVHFWRVPIPLVPEEPTIRLPEPATIRVPYSIKGDESEAEFQFYLRNPESAENRLFVRRTLKVPNGGEVVLRDATPGEYTLWRMKTIAHADYRQSISVEGRAISVERGRIVVADFNRERGAPIVGIASGPYGTQARTIFVGIEPVAGAAAAGKLAGFRYQLLEIVACGADGRFQTARIPPGEYVVRAVGYRNQPRFGPFAVMEVSDFIGSEPVVVPSDGKPPEVQIKLVDRSQETGPAK